MKPGKSGDDISPLDHDLEAWQNARQYAALLGEIPSSFSSITRSLALDANKGDGEMSQGTRFLMTRLLKGKVILAPFYYMSEALYPEEFENRVYISNAEILSLYKTFDLAAFVSVFYVLKKFSGTCPASEWSPIVSKLQRQVDVGIHLGLAIPAIGIGTGLLAAAMTPLSLGVFILHDAKGYVDYRRKLKGEIQALDYGWELSRWGCTSAHVASIFIQMFGLGVPSAHAFFQSAINPSENLSSETDNEVYKYKIARIWIDSLLKDSKIPNIAHRGRFYPEGGEIELLLEKLNIIKEAKPEDGWLLKTKDSISPELTPLLFKAGATKIAGSSASDEDREDIFGNDPFEPT